LVRIEAGDIPKDIAASGHIELVVIDTVSQGRAGPILSNDAITAVEAIEDRGVQPEYSRQPWLIY